MDFNQIMEAIKQIQTTLTPIVGTGTAISTIGGWVISLAQIGKKSNVFRISPERKSKVKKSRVPSDVALVVDVTWSIAPQVVKYLQQEKINAEILLMVNNQKDGKGKWLTNSKPKEWEAAVKDFGAIAEKIFSSAELSNSRIHIFIASPVALAFALGAVWGTVHHATIYHWDSEKKTYFPVTNISSGLKAGNKNKA